MKEQSQKAWRIVDASVFRDASWLTFERVWAIAVVFAVISVSTLGWEAWDHTRYGLTNQAGEQLGTDFINYWSGAHLASEGRAPLAYNIHAFEAYERSFTSPRADFRWYSYPPVTMLLTFPLAALRFVPALACWVAFGTVLVAWLLSSLIGWRMALLASIATPAAFLNIVAGQNGNFSAVLLAGGAMLLSRRPAVAGIFFGMMCYKPQLAVLVPFALIAGRYWRTFVFAGLTAAVLMFASCILLGAETWAAFIKTAPYNHLLMEQGVGFWHRMPTVFAFIRLIGGSIAVAYGAQVVSALLAIAAVMYVWRSPGSAAVKNAALFIGTFLATPYAWDYDLVILIFAAAMLAGEAQCSGFQPWEKATLAAIIAMPLFMLTIASVIHIQIGPFLLWAALLLLVRRSGDWQLRQTRSLVSSLG